MTQWKHETITLPRCTNCHHWRMATPDGLCWQCLSPEQKAALDAARCAAKVKERSK
jgi:predicted amidophosphoribosyltransferase